ncbi:MAG: ABC transporter permease [Candidatus Nomurabacteria bacterium]|nr:ABC transporter permease [Candidatus Nomurabacteria bacterium]
MSKLNIISELRGLYAIWYREILVFTREPSRLVGAIVQPLLWLVIFGTGLGSIIEPGAVSGANYQQFLFPGILAMTILFGSLFFGLYIILDKRIDFLKEVLVAPLNKSTMFFGKALGGSTDGLLQIIILMILGAIFFGIHFTLLSIILTLIIVILLLIAVTSLGLAIGSMMESPEGFGLISSFVIFPLFFLSGALFPVTKLPIWLKIVVTINPISYSVDALRSIIIGITSYGLFLDFVVTIVFALIMVTIGTWAFKRIKL